MPNTGGLYGGIQFSSGSLFSSNAQFSPPKPNPAEPKAAAFKSPEPVPPEVQNPVATEPPIESGNKNTAGIP